MPEGVAGYPKWEGTLRALPSFPVIAGQEIRRAWENPWARGALTLAFAYGIIYIGSLWTLAKTRNPAAVHTMDAFLYFLDLTRWAALAVAAVMAGSALLEDHRRNALELYLSRAVTRWDYLGGKVLAVLGLTFTAMALPALVYYGASWLLFDVQPEGWAWLPLRVLAYAAIWGLVVTGLGLGLAAIARSARAATLILFGAVAGLDVVLSNLLSAITKSDQYQILSPLSALAQQQGWLFGTELPYTFPFWWGLAALGALAAIGWGLVWWKHPKLRGVE